MSALSCKAFNFLKGGGIGSPMYFSKAAMVLASVPTVLISLGFISASSVLAQEASESVPQIGPPAVGEPAPQRPVAPLNRTRPTAVAPAPIGSQDIPLSPGDRLRITIPGIGGEEFSGEYEVNFNGDLEIPFLDPLSVLGKTATQVRALLRSQLLSEQLFLEQQLRVSVQVLDYAPIQISVNGAVFEPGRILLSRETALLSDAEGQVIELPGDYPLERYLTSALKASGGVRPTADVSRVQIARRGFPLTEVNLAGIFSGESVIDYPLVSGDEIVINPGEFDRDLVRPSQITPDSVDLYVSNVTQPGGGSVLSGTDNINVASFEYGTNLAQALVSARCVGGTRTTNANRRALLIKTDDETGGLVTSEYSVTDLVSSSTQSLEENPFLMPDDAIACYDSRNTNIRGILGTVVDFINPLNLLINLFDND